MEQFLKVIEPEMASMKKQFVCKKLNAVCDMNLINLGNIIYVEYTYLNKSFSNIQPKNLSNIVEEQESTSIEEMVIISRQISMENSIESPIDKRRKKKEKIASVSTLVDFMSIESYDISTGKRTL